MQNLEFKAELRDLVAARSQCGLLGARRVGVLRQVDTYFRLPDGRLKQREIVGEGVEWIFYHRPDRISPRVSVYSILTDDEARRRWGTINLQPWLTVSKDRELWLLGRTRIHLDRVDRLGLYFELETLMRSERETQEAQLELAQLREAFGPVLGEPVAVSYCDLMAQALAERPERA